MDIGNSTSGPLGPRLSADQDRPRAPSGRRNPGGSAQAGRRHSTASQSSTPRASSEQDRPRAYAAPGTPRHSEERSRTSLEVQPSVSSVFAEARTRAVYYPQGQVPAYVQPLEDSVELEEIGDRSTVVLRCTTDNATHLHPLLSDTAKSLLENSNLQDVLQAEEDGDHGEVELNLKCPVDRQPVSLADASVIRNLPGWEDPAVRTLSEQLMEPQGALQREVPIGDDLIDFDEQELLEQMQEMMENDARQGAEEDRPRRRDRVRNFFQNLFRR